MTPWQKRHVRSKRPARCVPSRWPRRPRWPQCGTAGSFWRSLVLWPSALRCGSQLPVPRSARPPHHSQTGCYPAAIALDHVNSSPKVKGHSFLCLSISQVDIFVAWTYQEQNSGQDLIDWVDLLPWEADDFKSIQHCFVSTAIIYRRLQKNDNLKYFLCTSSKVDKVVV